MTTPNTTAARKTYRNAAEPTASSTAADARRVAPQGKSAGQKVLMVVLFVFGMWRLSIGIMTLVGPSTTTHTSSYTPTTTSFCDTTPTPRGC